MCCRFKNLDFFLLREMGRWFIFATASWSVFWVGQGFGVHRFHIIGFWLNGERVPLGALSFLGLGGSGLGSGAFRLGRIFLPGPDLHPVLQNRMRRGFCRAWETVGSIPGLQKTGI